MKSIFDEAEGWTVQYPHFLELTDKASEVFWLAKEIHVEDDINNFLSVATDSQRHAMETIAKVFVQQELSVANYWIERIYKDFKRPEIRAMATFFGMTEQAIHARFYAMLPEALRLDSDPNFYKSYHDIPEFEDRMRIIGKSLKSNDIQLSIATFAVIEKVTLFTQFAVIKSFNVTPYNLFPKVADGINFSAVDEDCVMPETQVLTLSGWKEIQYLEDNETIMQWDMDGKLQWVTPSRVIRKHHTGGILSFDTSGNTLEYHQTVTPNHRMIRRYSNNSMGETNFEFIPANKLKPSAAMKTPINGRVIGSITNLTPYEQFCIAAQADGHVSDRYTGELVGTRPIKFFFSKQRKIDRITEILTKLGWEYTVRQTLCNGNKNDGSTFIVDVPMEYWLEDFKSLTSWVDITDKNHSWCQQFIDEVIRWDGHTNSKGHGVLYDSISKSNAETVRTIATLCGHSTKVTEKPDNRSDTFSTIYRVNITNHTEKRMGSVKKTEEDYDGMVYCVTVPSGAFLVKHKDAISVTGNCHGEGGILLFKLLEQEQGLSKSTIKAISKMANSLLEHEYALLDLIYEKGAIDTVTKEDLTMFLHERWNGVMKDLGMVFDAKPEGDNPVGKWFYKGLKNKMTSSDNFAALSNTYNKKWQANNFEWSTVNE